MNPNMFAKVILASKPENGAPPLITIRARYPRIIHSEILTHRVFSRNARSSRAVPVEKMLAEVRSDPFVPWHWGKNQKGMQAGEECNEAVLLPNWEDIDLAGKPALVSYSREEAWLKACGDSADAAEAYMNAGYHKQIANRLLEPFMWIDTLLTSTSWANFFHLRDHGDAEPHFHDLAGLVREAITGAEYQTLKPGEWHLPFISEGDRDCVCFDEGCGSDTEAFWNMLLKISAARCARISYAPFDGNGSFEAELKRYAQLIESNPMHASPVEHQAMPDTIGRYDHTRVSVGGKEELVFSGERYDNEYLSGNFAPGWIQYRKTLLNEYVAD